MKMNNTVELTKTMSYTFPNKIVKFRFFVEDGGSRMKLSKVLSIISQKYTPGVYYVRQLDDIRNIVNNIEDYKIRNLIEKRKEEFPDLYKEFLEIFNFWKKFQKDLKSYILVSFKIEYIDLLKDENI